MSGNLTKQLSQCLKWPVNGVLLDITGVLYESGAKTAIDGSVDAIKRLQSLGVPFRFVTNETQRTRSSLVEKLQSFGFKVQDKQVFSLGPCTVKILQEKQLRPFLLVHPDFLPEFSPCDQSSPNCVVCGDEGSHMSYEKLNRAFRLLMESENPVLISMGKGKYYRENGELILDVGAYTAALEYACGIEAITIGKPDPQFFQNALNDMNVKPEEAVMVGDDVNSDVGAAQKIGMHGVLVRTGKYRPADEHHESVKPNAIVDNLSKFVDILVAHNS